MNYNIDDSEDGLTFSQKQEILNKEKQEKEAKTEYTEYRAGETINFYESFVGITFILLGSIFLTAFHVLVLCILPKDCPYYKGLPIELVLGLVIFLIIFYAAPAIKIIIMLLTGKTSIPYISIYDDHIRIYQGEFHREKYIDLDFCEIERFQESDKPKFTWEFVDLIQNILFDYFPHDKYLKEINIILTPEAANKHGKSSYWAKNLGGKEIKQALAKKYTAWYNKQQQNHQ